MMFMGYIYVNIEKIFAFGQQALLSYFFHLLVFTGRYSLWSLVL